MVLKLFIKIVVLCSLFTISYLYFIVRGSFYYQSKKSTFTEAIVRNDSNNTRDYVDKNQRSKDYGHASDERNLKYILLWTFPDNIPFVYMGQGRSGFITRNCKHTNCFVTSQRNYLGDYTKFDVIAFAAPELHNIKYYPLPVKRSLHQKYVFASIESAANYPICTDKFDGFFNWTWTYRLDSDGKWGYIVVRDKKGKIIGPKKEMHWIKLEDMDPVSDDLKKNISRKSKAAAWFVSNCDSLNLREEYVENLQKALIKYNLTVDIYGLCGTLTCPRLGPQCDNMLEKDYYFYLSFENSFCEDYVTEKLLHPLKHNAVPIVYGGANYTRFMPDGIYLDAKKLRPKKLAEKIDFLIRNPEEYYQYFRWKNHYSFHRRIDSVETDDYCHFCEMLNDKDLVETVSIYKKLRAWWSPANLCDASKDFWTQ